MEAVEIAIRLLPHVIAISAFATLAIALWSLSWPSVKGLIEVSIFDQEWEHSGSLQKGTFEKIDKFYFCYSYTVEGVLFKSSRIAPVVELEWNLNFGGSPAWSGARDKAKWYREGATPEVYYCPLLPQWCCLERGGFLSAILLGAIAALLYWLI